MLEGCCGGGASGCCGGSADTFTSPRTNTSRTVLVTSKTKPSCSTCSWSSALLASLYARYDDQALYGSLTCVVRLPLLEPLKPPLLGAATAETSARTMLQPLLGMSSVGVRTRRYCQLVARVAGVRTAPPVALAGGSLGACS